MRYASRKFIIAVASLACAQWSLIGGLIDGQTWRTVVIAVLGLYSAANVAQRVLLGKDAQP
ncbi:MAG: hypothetical protein ABS84_14970 [Rubrivivax sp. SCN 71-131]|nr:MAG: hypothetical protein ABS84_14970 [Rubrivivax sp. SCN 71-131]